jgi:starch synthase
MEATNQRSKFTLAELAQNPALKILIVAAEVAPFAKVGHVAEVTGSLPLALKSLGHDVRVVMPRYGRIDPIKFDLKPLGQDFKVNIHATQENVYVTETTVAPTNHPEQVVPFYFINSEKYFNREGIYSYNDDDERFVLFCRSVLEMLPMLGWQPDIIHCHDWHTALIPNLLKTVYANHPFYRHTAAVYTIHNLAYQGIFGYRVLEIAGIGEYDFVYPRKEDTSVVSLMSLGIQYADVISTVSPTYAQEILTPQYGENLHPLLNQRQERLFGILNGINNEHFNPATDRFIECNYDVNSIGCRDQNKADLQNSFRLPLQLDVPILGMVTRLANQKGLDILAQIMERLLQLDVQFALMGTGDQYYHEFFGQIARKYPDKATVTFSYNSALAQKIYAGSDMLLMPSRFEPCGLGQMIAMRYGTIPIVRSTGGLADTVENYDSQTSQGNGFTFVEYDADLLFTTILRAIEYYKYPAVWQTLMRRAMNIDHSWKASASKYVELYRKAQAFHAASLTEN